MSRCPPLLPEKVGREGGGGGVRSGIGGAGEVEIITGVIDNSIQGTHRPVRAIATHAHQQSVLRSSTLRARIPHASRDMSGRKLLRRRAWIWLLEEVGQLAKVWSKKFSKEIQKNFMLLI